jgi:hypothetical protein
MKQICRGFLSRGSFSCPEDRYSGLSFCVLEGCCNQERRWQNTGSPPPWKRAVFIFFMYVMTWRRARDLVAATSRFVLCDSGCAAQVLHCKHALPSKPAGYSRLSKQFGDLWTLGNRSVCSSAASNASFRRTRTVRRGRPAARPQRVVIAPGASLSQVWVVMSLCCALSKESRDL